MHKCVGEELIVLLKSTAAGENLGEISRLEVVLRSFSREALVAGNLWYGLVYHHSRVSTIPQRRVDYNDACVVDGRKKKNQYISRQIGEAVMSRLTLSRVYLGKRTMPPLFRVEPRAS